MCPQHQHFCCMLLCCYVFNNNAALGKVHFAVVDIHDYVGLFSSVSEYVMTTFSGTVYRSR
jgi:hypothetical protein